MTDRELRDLLTDAVADVEPGHALDEIRARTTTTKRRWPYAAGGAVLAVAASFAAVAVLGNGTTPLAPDPGSTTSSSPTATDTGSATETPSQVVAVYYVGDTPDGLRLYREFRPAAGELSALEVGIEMVLSSPPLDVDYHSMWPRTGADLRSAEVRDGVIRIELAEAATQTHALPESERRAAIEQLIYTAQAAIQERLPVQFLVNGNPSAEILGLPASEPLSNGPVLDTLAHVSLTSPAEGMLVDNDEPLVVEGVGNSFEGNIVTRIEEWDGTPVLDWEPTIAGWGEDKLFPFEVTLDLTDVPPGDYAVASRTDDPSGQGRFHSDSKSITVVD